MKSYILPRAKENEVQCGHCWKSKEETIHKLLLWEPLHNKALGRPSNTYIDQMVDDSNIPRENAAVIEDRKNWNKCVNAVQLRSIR